MDPGPVPVQACCKMCSQGKACEDSASPGIGFARRGRGAHAMAGHRPGSACQSARNTIRCVFTE
jgi:hypothetical protein